MKIAATRRDFVLGSAAAAGALGLDRKSVV